MEYDEAIILLKNSKKQKQDIRFASAFLIVKSTGKFTDNVEFCKICVNLKIYL